MEGSTEQKLQTIINFITKEGVGVISTVGPTNLPDAAVVYFFVDNPTTITFLSNNESRKVTNITTNAGILLTVTNIENKTVVYARGTAQASTIPTADLSRRLQTLAERRTKSQDSLDTILPLLQYSHGPISLVTINITQLHWQKFGDKGMDEEFVELT